MIHLPRYVRERTDGAHRAGETGALLPILLCEELKYPVCIPMPGYLPWRFLSKDPPGPFFTIEPRRLLCIVHRRPQPIKWDMMDAEPADD